MFKSGQLVQSKATGLYYVVESVEFFLPGKLCLTHADNQSELFVAAPDSLRIIGNNYQPKDINKALREVRT